METGYTIADRYVCKKLLGKGGSGSVYMVYDMKLDKNWAVKLCHGGRPEEAAALKRIDCSAFPRIVDVIHQDDTDFLIMDYVDGITLSARCRLYAASEGEVLTWMLRTAEALKTLHEQTPPLLYMDCKPDNIMLTNSGDIRLVDLGSVYAYDSDRKGSVSSTRFFAPGEVVKPASGVRIGIHSDVYCFGMTMYRLLTGSSIEYRDSLGRLCPEHKNKHISKASQRIIKRCTAINPDSRYQSMQDIIRDLEYAINSVERKAAFSIPVTLNRLLDKLLKYALATVIIVCGIRLDTPIGLPVTSILFVLLFMLCMRPEYYSRETIKSVMRAH